MNWWQKAFGAKSQEFSQNTPVSERGSNEVTRTADPDDALHDRVGDREVARDSVGAVSADGPEFHQVDEALTRFLKEDDEDARSIQIKIIQTLGVKSLAPLLREAFRDIYKIRTAVWCGCALHPKEFADYWRTQYKMGLSPFLDDMRRINMKDGASRHTYVHRLLAKECESGGVGSNASMSLEADELFESGRLHYLAQNFPEALKYLAVAANHGHIESQCLLGVIYDNGQGVPRNYQEAIKWFESAAGKGSPLAQFGLGVMYRDGHGVAQNYQDAARWIILAAEQGYAEAEFNLGLMHLNGHGVAQSIQLAEIWWRRAADHGDANAIINLDSLKRRAAPTSFRWNDIIYTYNGELMDYFTIDEISDSSTDHKSVLIIQEPHHQVRQQWDLFCGLELLIEPLLGKGARLAFLSEGYPAYSEVSLAPLIRSNPDPSDRVIYKVLRSFLIPGYVAFAWRHQIGIKTFGVEDPTLYRLSADLWASHDIDAWNGTVVARNRKISEVIAYYTKSYDYVIAFVGGMHMRRIDNQAFLSSVEALRTRHSAGSANSVLTAGNLALPDYLSRSDIEYTFLSVKARASTDSSEELKRYRKLFAAQQNQMLDKYIADCVDGRSKLGGVTVAPSIMAAAKLSSIIGHGDNETNNDRDRGKKRTGDSKRKERKDIDRVARANNLDPNDFGAFVEATKGSDGLPPNFQYSNSQIVVLAQQFTQGLGR